MAYLCQVFEEIIGKDIDPIRGIDYVKYYKKVTNSEFDGRKFEIHHIDGDRANNHISNLVALPRKLHIEYHKISKELPTSNICIEEKILSSIETGHGDNFYLHYVLSNFIEIYAECQRWADYRNYLLGYFPNVHNLSYE